MRLKLKNKMLAILPQIYESGIWKKYAGSIVEYAGKYGDMAQTTVRKRLRLEENLKDKPFLKAAIAKIGVHKVAMVAKIATPETDQALAERVLNMSKMAVQSLSKELRAGQNSLPCKAVAITKKIEMDEESTFIFLKLKAKLGKHLSDKEFLKMILEKMKKQEFLSQNRTIKSVTGDTGRYIRVAEKRRIIEQTNGKCGYPNCNVPYEVLHHTDRYSESKNHESVMPFCKIHHEFAHNNLIHNETQTTDHWRMAVIKPLTAEISQADILYRKYRRAAIM